MPPSGKEVVKKLKKLGWRVVQQRGSHVKLKRDEQIVVIPVHGNQDLGVGLLKSIEKQTSEVLQ
jgi:predicted RNA binding protein YcfA (HicA-like mRNA interferase family)